MTVIIPMENREAPDEVQRLRVEPVSNGNSMLNIRTCKLIFREEKILLFQDIRILNLTVNCGQYY